MVHAKCIRPGCEFYFDDAEHMDDAISKLRAHFRMEHPTKAFYENHYLEEIEMFNMSIDEQIGRQLGMNDWRERLQNDRLQARHIVSACQQLVRHHRHYSPECVDDAIALAREYGTQIADPRQAAQGVAVGADAAGANAIMNEVAGMIRDDIILDELIEMEGEPEPDGPF